VSFHDAPVGSDSRTTDAMSYDASPRRQSSWERVSAGELNRELTALKRMFNLARQAGKLL